jgi:hypothetical protein
VFDWNRNPVSAGFPTDVVTRAVHKTLPIDVLFCDRCGTRSPLDLSPSELLRAGWVEDPESEHRRHLCAECAERDVAGAAPPADDADFR